MTEVRAPGYLTRSLRLPFRTHPQSTVRLYRASLQWPMYGVDPGRTQAQTDIHLRPPFRVLWSRATGSLTEFPAVVSEGVAYVGNYYGTVRALAMNNGRLLWRRRTPNGKMASSPAIWGDRLVVHGTGVLAVRLGAFALCRRAPPLGPRQADDDRGRRDLAAHDLLGEIVDPHLGRAGRVPEQREGARHVEVQALAEDSLGLLDDDARFERGLQLLHKRPEAGELVREEMVRLWRLAAEAAAAGLPPALPDGTPRNEPVSD